MSDESASGSDPDLDPDVELEDAEEEEEEEEVAVEECDRDDEEDLLDGKWALLSGRNCLIFSSNGIFAGRLWCFQWDFLGHP